MTYRGPFQPQPFGDSGTGPNSAFCVALRKCLSYPTVLIPHFCWETIPGVSCVVAPPKNLGHLLYQPQYLSQRFFHQLGLGGKTAVEISYF